MTGKRKSALLDILCQRGYIHQISDGTGLDDLLCKAGIAGYIGIDCTAPSPHVGNLVGLMLLYWMQHTGHRPIVLIGGGTTRVGDPSGRDSARRLLDLATIEKNRRGIRDSLRHLLRFDGGDGAIMADNAEWLASLDLFGFLRDVGRHFSVNQMIQRDSIRLRLERAQHLSFLEFSYMLLQAYDFTELARRHACRIQFGGSDQWGNIVSGIDLGRRLGTPPLFGLTTPLMTTGDGAKMGKSASGAVWLSPAHLSNYEYWQFWRNTGDGDVGRFLRLFTALPLDEIARLDALGGSEINAAKKILADEATTLVRGPDAAREGRKATRSAFGGAQAVDGLPMLEVGPGELQAGLGLLSTFVRGGLCASNGEARRVVRGGGARVNDAVESREDRLLQMADLSAHGTIKLSLGRKRHMIVRLLPEAASRTSS